MRWLNLGLVISSLLGYLEWGGGNSTFLFEVELEVIQKLFVNPMSAIHPFTVLPLIGQIILLINLLRKSPSHRLTWIGIVCIGVLFLFMMVIGCITLNWQIIVSTIPFLFLSYVYVRKSRMTHKIAEE